MDIQAIQEMLSRTTKALQQAANSGDPNALALATGNHERVMKVANETIQHVQAQQSKIPGSDNGGPTNTQVQGEPLWKSAQPSQPKIFPNIPEAPQQRTQGGTNPSWLRQEQGFTQPPQTPQPQQQNGPWGESEMVGPNFTDDRKPLPEGVGTAARVGAEAVASWNPLVAPWQAARLGSKALGYDPDPMLKEAASGLLPAAGGAVQRMAGVTDAELGKLFGSKENAQVVSTLQAPPGPGGQATAPTKPAAMPERPPIGPDALEVRPEAPMKGQIGNQEYMLPWDKQSEGFQKTYGQEEADMASDRQQDRAEHTDALEALKNYKGYKPSGLEALFGFLFGGPLGLAKTIAEEDDRGYNRLRDRVSMSGGRASGQPSRYQQDESALHKRKLQLEEAKIASDIDKQKQEYATDDTMKEIHGLEGLRNSLYSSMTQDPKTRDTQVTDINKRLESLYRRIAEARGQSQLNR